MLTSLVEGARSEGVLSLQGDSILALIKEILGGKILKNSSDLKGPEFEFLQISALA